MRTASGNRAAAGKAPGSASHVAPDGVPDEMTLKQRYDSVRERIAAAARRSGRRPEDVVLVAVTKFASMDQIRELIKLGHIDFGENRVQHLVQRAAQVDEYLHRHRQMPGSGEPDLPERVRWHMIGHLQRNKVRKVMSLVRLVHSVDSLRLAEEMHGYAARIEEPVEVLVQVNTSGERSKFGIAPAAAVHLIEQIESMLSLRVRGLMCMAPLVDTPEQARPTFQRCRELFEEIRRSAPGGVSRERFNILSMGMTSDFEVAIECGANIVRVGSAIFSEREVEEEPAEPDSEA
ncbi:MAG TPA: YggS family pyridoxal phosphate-dependent enzyme [Phycisphaerales bacterium]|nr:YggS family pyridoxal phosphate-dependent enzyme [Phycisphaerales bacterium]